MELGQNLFLAILFYQPAYPHLLIQRQAA